MAAVGRVFKIRKNQAKGYGYAAPKGRGFRSNPGVATIAAINGRGAYRSRSARSSMTGLSKNARVAKAKRQLSSAERRAFVMRMNAGRGAKLSKNIGRLGRATGRGAVVGRRPLTRNARPPVRRVVLGTNPISRPAGRRTATGVVMKKNRRRKSAALSANARRRRKTVKRRRAVSKAPVKRRKKRKTKAKATPVKRRKRRKTTAKKRRKTTKKRRTSSRKLRANRKRKAPKRRRKTAARRTRKAGKRRTRRSSKRRARSGTKSRKRVLAGRKAARTRNARQAAKSEADYAYNGRRKSRRKHRKNKRSLKTNRRRARRNGRRSAFRRNGVVGVLGSALKMGGLLLLGFGGHRVLANLIDKQVLQRLLPAPTPAPTSGTEFLSKYSGLVAAVITAGAGIPIANAVIKDAEVKKLVIGGIAVSALQGVFVSLLRSFYPQGAQMLAGPDSEAFRLAATYGVGAGESIGPRYTPISATGEYFTNGVGEYLAAQGVGEYFTNGVGSYGPNPDLMQAAAGMGNPLEVSGNHIDPSSDLDRELTIAEAAAGVGALAPFEAAAGMGSAYEAAAGLGAGIATVPGANTWIPGTSDGQLWAGTRGINKPQAATEMIPAGVLNTPGKAGIFG